MNIVLYVNSFLPQIGGRELVVFHLARALKHLGHDVRVVGPAGWRSERRGPRFEFPVHRQPATAAFRIWREYWEAGRKRAGLRGTFEELVKQLQLLWNLKRWGCDVIHAHSTYPNGYNAARLRRWLNVPLVVTPHGEDIHRIPAIGFGLRLNYLLEPRIRYALHKADALTAISADVETSLLDAGAHLGRVYRIANGVDLSRFDKKHKGDLSRWLGSQSHAPLITTIGNYHPRKGHEVTLRAMPAILAREPRARLIIVGRGTEVLQGLVDQLDLHRSVVLAGTMALPKGSGSNESTADPLATLLCRSAVYVSAAIGEGAEGLSLAILEAMAAGLPIVATRISGNRDVVSDGENGILIAPNDSAALAEAVIGLLKDEPRRAAYGREARATAERFEWTEIARQYVTLYQQVVDSAKLAWRPRAKTA